MKHISGLFGRFRRLFVVVSRIDPLMKHRAGYISRSSPVCQSTLRTIRQAGKPSHPQNCVPVDGPRFAVRITIFRPQLGHNRGSDPSLRRLKFFTCRRSVLHDGFIRPVSIAVQISANCLSDRIRVLKDRMYRPALPNPTVTFSGISVLKAASPTKTTTDFTAPFGSPIPANEFSIALTCL